MYNSYGLSIPKAMQVKLTFVARKPDNTHVYLNGPIHFEGALCQDMQFKLTSMHFEKNVDC